MLDKMKELLKAKDICVLATVSDNRPHCSLMVYATDEQCREIYMVTHRQTKKFRNLTENPVVSLLIDTREEDLGPRRSNAKALTVNGVFRVMNEPHERGIDSGPTCSTASPSQELCRRSRRRIDTNQDRILSASRRTDQFPFRSRQLKRRRTLLPIMRVFSAEFFGLGSWCPASIPQDVIPAFVWRESRRKFWMPTFAGMTAENRTPICVVLH